MMVIYCLRTPTQSSDERQAMIRVVPVAYSPSDESRQLRRRTQQLCIVLEMIHRLRHQSLAVIVLRIFKNGLLAVQSQPGLVLTIYKG